MTRKRRRSGPDFVRFFQPIINALNDKDASATPREVYDWIIEHENISEAELTKVNKNGRSNFENKVAFARYYLSEDGFIDSSTRGIWALTEKGRKANLDPDAALLVFDRVHASVTVKRERQVSTSSDVGEVDNEEVEGISDKDQIFDRQSDSEDQLRRKMISMSPQGFEEFTAFLLRKLGLDNVTAQGGSGDQGIDGIGELKVSRFMRMRVAYQCKRYQEKNAITPSMVRDFRGAITGRVDRGLFITTSRFSRAARDEAKRENVIPIELIDIDQLVEILIEERIGVSEVRALKVDEVFFDRYREKQA